MLVRKLALRLVAGQTSNGGWTYECPLLNAEQERDLLASLQWGGPNRPRARLEKRTVRRVRSRYREVPRKGNLTASPEQPCGTTTFRGNTFAQRGAFGQFQHAVRHAWLVGRTAPRLAVGATAGSGRAAVWRESEPGRRLGVSISAAGHPADAVDELRWPSGSRRRTRIGRAGCRLGFRHRQGIYGIGVVRRQTAGLEAGARRRSHGDQSLFPVVARTYRRSVQPPDDRRQGLVSLGSRVASRRPSRGWLLECGRLPGAIAVTDSCFALLFLKRANLAKDLTKKLESSAEDKKRDEHP